MANSLLEKMPPTRGQKISRAKRIFKFTRDFLHEEYVYKKKSIRKIAVEQKCSSPVIYERLKELHIPRRSLSESHKGLRPWMLGRKHTDETKEKIRAKRAKQTFSQESIKKRADKIRGHPHWGVIRHTLATRLKMSITAKRLVKEGKNPLFIDGKWRERYNARLVAMQSFDYKTWRRAVFERDDYTCQHCGQRGNGTLEADHIKPWALFKELRYDVNNGRTLCKSCHRKTPTYGNRLRRKGTTNG